MESEEKDSGFVVRSLVEYVRENDVEIGSRLPNIAELADMWGLKRGVVRDGLLQARNLGMVEILPRRGTFLRSPDYSPLVDALSGCAKLIPGSGRASLIHLIEARCVLEAEAAAIAAGRRRLEDMLELKQCLLTMADLSVKRPAFIDANEKFHLGIAALGGNSVIESFLKALLSLLRPHRYTFSLTNGQREKTNRPMKKYTCV